MNKKMNKKWENKTRLLASIPTEAMVEYPKEGGVLTYFKGQKYPVHGALTDEALWATEMLKKYVMGWARVLVGNPFRIVERWMFNFGRFSGTIFVPYFQVEELSPAVRHFYDVSINLWRDETSVNISKGICMILENDKAYRFRWQDIMMCVNRQALIDYPGKEIARLVKIYLRREQRKEYQSLKWLIRMFLFFKPSVKKIIRDFARTADFKKFAMDRYDFHAALRQASYNYDDKGFEERLAIVNIL